MLSFQTKRPKLNHTKILIIHFKHTRGYHVNMHKAVFKIMPQMKPRREVEHWTTILTKSLTFCNQVQNHCLHLCCWYVACRRLGHGWSEGAVGRQISVYRVDLSVLHGSRLGARVEQVLCMWNWPLGTFSWLMTLSMWEWSDSESLPSVCYCCHRIKAQWVCENADCLIFNWVLPKIFPKVLGKVIARHTVFVGTENVQDFRSTIFFYQALSTGKAEEVNNVDSLTLLVLLLD